MFFQSCNKPCHLIIYFAEVFSRLYLQNINNMVNYFLDYLLDFEKINSKLDIDN